MSRIAVCLCLAVGLRAQTSSIPWSSFGHDPQHTGLSTIGAERLETIKWSIPIDLVLAGTSGPLYIHYGSPVITAGNTVLVPVRTSSANTYNVEALSGSNGTLLYTLPSDYTPPPHNWIPAYGATLSMGTRVYYAGAGGTVYYRDQPDSSSGTSGQIAFYGNALYSANAAAFANNVMISTPITADGKGNIYFGFVAAGPNPASLTSGLARIDANGTGSWTSASAAAGGDGTIVEVAMNCAPAVSNDGSTLYFAVSEGNGTGGYLVSVNSTTLTPIARVRLKDPETLEDAMLLDDSSASPTVGPDGDVYYGVVESTCCTNDDRGWMLHFNSPLSQTKTPGAFGWDTTASVVPASAVASYQGPSSYLLFTKYNNYAGIGPGGNGQNKIAVLDPNQTETDPITGVTVMQEVLTILGPTPASAGGVKEWCINSAAIDPFNPSAIANSEDGNLYRWSFATNTFTQQVSLTGGVAESYTPTAIGADGTAYAINDATLFAVGQAANLTITSTHPSNFTPGQNGAQYTLIVTNTGSSATNGTVVVTDTVPAGLTAVSIQGSGWNCTQPSGPCQRADSLAVSANYPQILLTVNVSANAPFMVTNVATVSSDGAANSVNSTASDVTYIGNLPNASLQIGKSHSGLFSQGQMNALYTLIVSNAAGAGPAAGAVTVSENVPAGLNLVSMAGVGWTCMGTICTRSDSLAAGGVYPAITVTVNVTGNAPSPQINSVTVSGGGSSPATATDTTIIQPAYTNITIQTVPSGLEFTLDNGAPQTAPAVLALSLGPHTIAVPPSEQGTPGTLYLFSSWSDGGALSHSITVGPAPATYTATFNTQYELIDTASPAAGGTVSPPDGSFYAPGTVVQVSAVANTGYGFLGWNGPVASLSNAATSVVINAPVTISANFAKVNGISISNCSATAFVYAIGQSGTTPTSIACTVTNTLAIQSINGLTVSGLPTWLSGSLSAASLPIGGSATLTLTPTNLASVTTAGTLGPPAIVVSGSPSPGTGTVSGILAVVTLTVYPMFSLNPTSVSFDVPTMSAAESQQVSLTDSPATPEPITASVNTASGGTWLAATGGNTPLTSTVTVTPSALAQGAYTGTVVYTSGGAPGVPSLAVLLNVGQLAVSGGPVAFSQAYGATAAPATSTLNVSAGPAAINWVSATSGDCLWLTQSATSGATVRGGSVPVTISYSLAGVLAAGVGTHVCTLSYAAAASYGSTTPAVLTTVTLNVYPGFAVNPSTLTFDLPTMAAPQSQTVSVTDSPATPTQVAASVSTGGSGSWLSATGGTTPVTSTITVSDAALAAGTYSGMVNYTSPSAPSIPSVGVTLNVGQLAVSGGPVTFQYVSGVTTPGTATINVSAGTAAVNWVSGTPVPAAGTANCSWLTESATSGTTPRGGSSPVSIGYSVSGLPATTATYQCTINYSAAPGYGSTAAAVPVTVTLNTQPAPAVTLSATPSSQTDTVATGATTAPGLTFQVSAGSVPPPATSLTVTVAPASTNPVGPGSAPIFTALTTLNVPSAPATAALTIGVNPTGLAIGTYQGSFTLTAGSASATITVNLVVVAASSVCSFSISPPSPYTLTNAVPATGAPTSQPGNVTVTPTGSCAPADTWTATSGANWLVITSGATGNSGAPGILNFTALSNPTSGCAGVANCTPPQPRTATITITPSAGSPVVETFTQSGSTAAIVDRQVTALYQSILGRDPDPTGYAFWTGGGSAGLSTMADDFLTSPEAFNSDFAVIAAYQAATGAPPAYANFVQGVQSIRYGTQTIAGLFGSLIAANSSYTAATLYQNLLNRAPSAAETSACTPLATCFTTLIGYPASTTPIGAANNEFQSTGTFASMSSTAGDHTNSLYITLLYFVILNRDPDTAGLDYWLSVANSGGAGILFQGATGYATRIQILGPPIGGQGFIGSAEFQSLFQ